MQGQVMPRQQVERFAIIVLYSLLGPGKELSRLDGAAGGEQDLGHLPLRERGLTRGLLQLDANPSDEILDRAAQVKRLAEDLTRGCRAAPAPGHEGPPTPG